MKAITLSTILAAALAATACGSGSESAPAASDSNAALQPATPASSSETSSVAAGDDAPRLLVPVSSNAEDARCGADKLGRWLNVLPTDDVKADIAKTVGDRPIRYYTQGDPITMDFSPARLNAELGEDGRIKLFRCG